MTPLRYRGSKMQSIHNVFKLQKEGCAEMCSADREVLCLQVVANRQDLLHWPSLLGAPGNHEGLYQWMVFPYRENNTDTVPRSSRGESARAKPSPVWGAFLMSWSKQMKGIPTSKLSPFFSEGKVAVLSLTFTNTSIQLMQDFKCSLSFSYPVLETA